jgi:hypothetical protein
MRDALHAMRRLSAVSGRPPDDVALWLSAALVEYLFDTTMAIALLLENAYLDQALPLVRVALSTTTNLLAIWRDPDEANGVALQYLLFSQHVRHTRFQRRGGRYGLDPALAERIEVQELEREGRVLGRLETERGVKAIPFGSRHDTWSGLSDRDLIALVWWGDEWQANYGDLSNASHANVAGIWHRLIDSDRSALEAAFSAREVADLTISLFERGALVVAKQLADDIGDAVGQAASAFWWSADHGQEVLELYEMIRPSKYDLEDEENPRV